MSPVITDVVGTMIGVIIGRQSIWVWVCVYTVVNSRGSSTKATESNCAIVVIQFEWIVSFEVSESESVNDVGCEKSQQGLDSSSPLKININIRLGSDAIKSHVNSQTDRHLLPTTFFKGIMPIPLPQLCYVTVFVLHRLCVKSAKRVCLGYRSIKIIALSTFLYTTIHYYVDG